ncbi:MAG: hypothetical protein ACR2NZ_00245 [Rubripirellula sp.]
MADPAPPSQIVSGGEFAEIVPPERTTPALIMSLVLHVVLLTSIGLIWSRTANGTGEEADRPVGIALVHRMPDRDRYVDAADVPDVQTEATTESDASASSSAAAPPADLSPPLDLAGVLQSMQATPSPVSGTGLTGEADLDGDAFSTGPGTGSEGDSAEATTMVFGISGSGSRFVYVFDRSDSMNGFGGKPLRAAKSELIRSLRTLTERQRFQLIFYNDKPTPFKMSGVPLQMISGEEAYVALAESYIRSIAAFGGTEHESAIKMALRMAPDVIFFLTDARIPRLSTQELREIKNRADASGATIHAIEFGAEPIAPRDSFLRDLASQNRGQYRYIDVRSLGGGGPVPAPDRPPVETKSPAP